MSLVIYVNNTKQPTVVVFMSCLGCTLVCLSIFLHRIDCCRLAQIMGCFQSTGSIDFDAIQPVVLRTQEGLAT